MSEKKYIPVQLDNGHCFDVVKLTIGEYAMLVEGLMDSKFVLLFGVPSLFVEYSVVRTPERDSKKHEPGDDEAQESVVPAQYPFVYFGAKDAQEVDEFVTAFEQINPFVKKRLMDMLTKA